MNGMMKDGQVVMKTWTLIVIGRMNVEVILRITFLYTRLKKGMYYVIKLYEWEAAYARWFPHNI